MPSDPNQDTSPLFEHLRFSPDILIRLGEELIPNIDLGIIELVKNAYDADALTCSVELVDTNAAGGTIRVVDDGIGMDIDAIRSGWLVLGRSSKSGREVTRLGRTPVGDKGLGRLSALRFGSSVLLQTRPRSEPGIQYDVCIEWVDFTEARTIDEVPLRVIRSSTTGSSGTTIEIRGLKPIRRKEVTRLARSLVLLADPFSSSSGFRPSLIAPEFADLERRVQQGYLAEAQYHLRAWFNSKGRACAEVTDHTGKSVFRASQVDLSQNGRRYAAPAASFDLWMFLRKAGTLTTSGVRQKEISDWLDVVGGVHFYQRKMRVPPYGDPGHDWLDMNLRRVQTPEERPSTNNAVGCVMVSDEADVLVQKTDRVGFVENDAFREIRRFCTDALEWMWVNRMRVAEARRGEERAALKARVEQEERRFRQLQETIPSEQRELVDAVVEARTKTQAKEVSLLTDEVSLYRTLASVGTAVAVFAHESPEPADLIVKNVKTVQKRARDRFGADYEEAVGGPLERIESAAKRLLSFALFPLKLLESDKRRARDVHVNDVVESLMALFAPYLQEASIEIQLSGPEEMDPIIRGSVAAVESILSNLILNSVRALSTSNESGRSRTIAIRTDISGQTLVLRVLDSGPGIKLSIDRIWLPGVTSRLTEGTGLGLTIVSHTVEDLGGRVDAIANGELGGAEFVIQLPLMERNR